MSEKNKGIEFITKLIELTQKSVIKWSSSDPSKIKDKNAAWNIIGSFIADYKSKKMRVYSYRHKVKIDPRFRALNFSFEQDDEWEVVVESRLELIDVHENVLWRFSNLNPTGDLFKAVQKQVSGVDNFIDNVLSEK